MATPIDILKVRNILGRKAWAAPEPLGSDGWMILRNDHRQGIAISTGMLDGIEWTHASICNHDRRTMPNYFDLTLLHCAVFEPGYSYQVFAPAEKHINIHPTTLHLWGRTDGLPRPPRLRRRRNDMSPQRVQRRRTEGWRMPAGAIYVGRGTRWGNPWIVHAHTLRCGPGLADCPTSIAYSCADAVQKYRHSVLYPLVGQPPVPTPDEIRVELRGHDLACWCPLDQPCHADVLLELANGATTGDEAHR